MLNAGPRRLLGLLIAMALAAASLASTGFVPVSASSGAWMRFADDVNPRLAHTRHATADPGQPWSGLQVPGPRTSAGSTSGTSLASCQSTWSGVPSPDASGHNELNAIAAVSAGDIWAAGRSTTDTGVEQTLAEHWNGSVWGIVPSPNTNAGTGDNVLASIAAVSTSDAWAVGLARPDQMSAAGTLAEHWDGSSWTIVASPNGSGTSSALFSVKGDASNDYWAVGRTESAGSEQPLAELWNGTSWTVYATPSPMAYSLLIAVKVISPTNVWAVGGQSSDNVNFKTLIEHWTGPVNGWAVAPSSNSVLGNGFLLGIDGTANDLWAVGAGQSTGFDVTLIEHWDGTSWTTVGSPTGSDTDLNSVVSISASNAWAVGVNFGGTQQAPADQTVVEHWDGSSWNAVASPNAGSSSDLFDVAALSGSDVWAAGLWINASGTEQTLVENYCVPPTITSVNPTSGPATGGTGVTITGTGLVWATGFKFGKAAASNVTVNSDTQATATSPSGPVSTVDVYATYFAGLSAATAADRFTYLAAAPLAPGKPVGIGGDSSATVYWPAPSSDGGAPIASYTVSTYLAGVSQGTMTVTGSPAPSSATITGLSNGSAYTFTVTATNSVGTGPASPASDPVIPGRGTFHSLVPARILDTRPSSQVGPYSMPVGQGGTIAVQVAGQGGVPSSGAVAAILNITVTNPTAGSFLTVWPAGVPRPFASNLNFTAGTTVPNLVEIALGSGGQVDVYNAAGSTDVIIDVAGYVSTPTATPGVDGLYNPVVPYRVLDTRSGIGAPLAPVFAGQTINVQVGGVTGSNVPASHVSAVVLNVTATQPNLSGSFLTVFPMGAQRPVASNLNFVIGQTVPNRVIVKVGTNPQPNTSGWISIYNQAGSVHVIVDVAGWFTDGTDPTATGSAFVGMSPVRVADTRNGPGPVGSQGTMVLQIAGSNGVPSSATAVVINVTVTNPTAASFLTVWPDGPMRPFASDLNYLQGLTVPNLVVAKVGANGKVDFYNAAGSTDVIVDVVGWYQ